MHDHVFINVRGGVSDGAWGVVAGRPLSGADVLTPFAPVSTCVYQVKGLGTVCIGLGTVCIR